MKSNNKSKQQQIKATTNQSNNKSKQQQIKATTNQSNNKLKATTKTGRQEHSAKHKTVRTRKCGE
jgi:hypothetical protein